jgi:methyl-accepting chemotaxis protein
MAQKIAKGINVPNNCIEKSHKEVLKDHQNAKINLQSFQTVLEDTARIREMVESIMSNIGDITESITAYNSMIREIEKIAMQVKMIATNASIEAARAGEHGKAFSVVAGEIRNLAQKSTASAMATKEASIKATGAIDTVNAMMLKINERVHASYENMSDISKKTKEILDVRPTVVMPAIVVPDKNVRNAEERNSW